MLNDKTHATKTGLHAGAFTKEFTREFDVLRFIIIIDNETTLDFHDTLIATIDYWKTFFNTTL